MELGTRILLDLFLIYAAAVVGGAAAASAGAHPKVSHAQGRPLSLRALTPEARPLVAGRS